MSGFLIGTLEFGKVLISIFIMWYAYFFLTRSIKHHEKRPWQYLFVASMLLFFIMLVSALQFFKGGIYKDSSLNNIVELVEFAFLVFFLFSFIYQHHLLRKVNILVITRRKGKFTDILKEKYILFLKKKQTIMDNYDEEKGEQEIKREMKELDDEFREEEEQLEELVGKPKDSKKKKKTKKTKKKKKSPKKSSSKSKKSSKKKKKTPKKKSKSTKKTKGKKNKK